MLKIIKTHKHCALLAALLLPLNTVWANSDMQMMEQTLKAMENRKHQGMDHSQHQKGADENKVFRGVFYGYLPCSQKGCDGTKMTLSLKQKKNYLLVIQPAKASNREIFEKGKYNWDSKQGIVYLTPKKGESRQFKIKSDATLVLLKADGSPMPGSDSDYSLQRSDSVKNRQVHIH